MSTTAALVATKKFVNDKSDPWTWLNKRSIQVTDWIDRDINDSSHEINVSPDSQYEIRVPDASSVQAAQDSSKTWIINNTDLYSLYDSVIVHDTRDFSGVGGWADVKSAGNNGHAYCDAGYWAYGPDWITAHELMHTYGGLHPSDSNPDNFDRTTWDDNSGNGSIMMNNETATCKGGNVATVYPSTNPYFTLCTESEVHNYMDNNGL